MGDDIFKLDFKIWIYIEISPPKTVARVSVTVISTIE